MKNCDIGMVVAHIKNASRSMQHCLARRAGWNGKNMFIALREADDDSDMTLPYVYMYTAQRDTIPWLCSQADLLATDWETSNSAGEFLD